MYINKTYQDYMKAVDKDGFLVETISDYRNSKAYKTACTAERYFTGQTDIISKPRKTRMHKYEYTNDEQELIKTASEIEYDNNHVSNNFIKRFVMQATQYLLNEGIQLDKGKKAKLGANADNIIQIATEKAQVHGSSVLFWNYDHLELFTIADKNNSKGMFFLIDEETSELKLGIRFWQINANKPLYFEVYYKFYTIGYKCKKLEIIAKNAYITKVIKTAFETTTEELQLGYLPFAILKNDEYENSILSVNVKSKIDLYDTILSDFGDNMERLEDIYWAIKNFGGTGKQARCMLADIEKYK